MEIPDHDSAGWTCTILPLDLRSGLTTEETFAAGHLLMFLRCFFSTRGDGGFVVERDVVNEITSLLFVVASPPIQEV